MLIVDWQMRKGLSRYSLTIMVKPGKLRGIRSKGIDFRHLN